MRRWGSMFLAIALIAGLTFVGALPVFAEGAVLNLEALSVNDGESIVLTWDEMDFGNNEEIYIWRRSFACETTPNISKPITGNPEWVMLTDTVNAGVRTYTDTNLIDGNSYQYKLSASIIQPEDTGVSNWAASKPVLTTLNGKEVYNVARGKPVKSSKDADPSNRQAWKMVDGVEHHVIQSQQGHFWSGYGAAPQSAIMDNNWVRVTLDLLNTEEFDTITLMPRMNEIANPTNGYGPKQIRIYVSDNEENLYSTVPVYQTFKNPEVNFIDKNTDLSVFNISVGALKARYIGLHITESWAAASGGNYNVQIRELKVYRKPKSIDIHNPKPIDIHSPVYMSGLDDQTPISSLQTGFIQSSLEITNSTGEAQPVIFFMMLKKKPDSSIVNIAAIPRAIAANTTETFIGGVNVPTDYENYIIEIMVLDSAGNMDLLYKTVFE